MWVTFVTHFVVTVMQQYLGPEIQHIIISMVVSFYRCNCYGKILNKNTHSQYQYSQVS